MFFAARGVRLRACEVLQQRLKGESSGQNLVRPEKRVSEHLDLGRRLLCISTSGQRPDADVDKEAHTLRPRSAL